MIMQFEHCTKGLDKGLTWRQNPVLLHPEDAGLQGYVQWGRGQVKRPRNWRTVVIILTKVQHRIEGPWEYDGVSLSSHKQLHIFNGFFEQFFRL